MKIVFGEDSKNEIETFGLIVEITSELLPEFQFSSQIRLLNLIIPTFLFSYVNLRTIATINLSEIVCIRNRKRIRCPFVYRT